MAQWADVVPTILPIPFRSRRSASFSGSDCATPLCRGCGADETCIFNGTIPHCWQPPAGFSCPRCVNGGTCASPSTVCSCSSNFQGPRCETPVCPTQCSNNGFCSLQVGVPTSYCVAPFTGLNSAIETCTIDRCKNGGMCVSPSFSAGPTCQCVTPFGGPFCKSQFSIEAARHRLRQWVRLGFYQ